MEGEGGERGLELGRDTRVKREGLAYALGMDFPIGLKF